MSNDDDGVREEAHRILDEAGIRDGALDIRVASALALLRDWKTRAQAIEQGPTYADGVRSGVKRAAAWLREHGDKPGYAANYISNNPPSTTRLADALDRMADEGEGA